jgi:hypothetical protein
MGQVAGFDTPHKYWLKATNQTLKDLIFVDA